MHSHLLTAQHKDLKSELEEFMRTEDIVRSGLDRQTRVHHLQNKVNSTIM